MVSVACALSVPSAARSLLYPRLHPPIASWQTGFASHGVLRLMRPGGRQLADRPRLTTAGHTFALSRA
eukprot:4956965-Pleurochrysis_carterae.AAC.1